jgi:hypothetical protein
LALGDDTNALSWQLYSWRTARWRFCRLAYVVMLRRRGSVGCSATKTDRSQAPKHSWFARTICVALRFLPNPTLRVSVGSAGARNTTLPRACPRQSIVVWKNLQKPVGNAAWEDHHLRLEPHGREMPPRRPAGSEASPSKSLIFIVVVDIPLQAAIPNPWYGCYGCDHARFPSAKLLQLFHRRSFDSKMASKRKSHSALFSQYLNAKGGTILHKDNTPLSRSR